MRVQRGKRERGVLRLASQERQAMPPCHAKPEKILVADRFGNVRLTARVDSTMKVRGLNSSHSRTSFEGAKNTLAVMSRVLLGQSDLDYMAECDEAMKRTDSRIRKLPVGNPTIGDTERNTEEPMVRVGTTPARKLLLVDDDGKRKLVKLAEKPRFVVVGHSGSVPNGKLSKGS